jgi:hypothetical protein
MIQKMAGEMGAQEMRKSTIIERPSLAKQGKA